MVVTKKRFALDILDRRYNNCLKVRNLPKIPDYTRRAHVLRDIKHSVKVQVNTRGKENPIKAVMRWQS